MNSTMWFKNLTLLKLQASDQISLETLEEKLQTRPFCPVGALEVFSEGWCPPLGQPDAAFVQRTSRGGLICLRREDRVLPSAAVRERLSIRIEEVEAQEGRKLGRKARESLRDEVLKTMMPLAFTQSRKTWAYLDLEGGWLWVDTASAKRAEDLVCELRKTLEGFPVKPVSTRERPQAILTHWLATSNLPEGLSLESECELKSPETDGSIVRARRHDLFAPEITRHVEAGKEVSRLALSWLDRLTFILDEMLVIRRLRFLETSSESDAGADLEDEAMRFDQDLALMVLELENFIPVLLGWFGGDATLDGGSS